MSGCDIVLPYHNPRYPRFRNLSDHDDPTPPYYVAYARSCPVWMRWKYFPCWRHQDYPSVYAPKTSGTLRWTNPTNWSDPDYPLIEGHKAAGDNVGGVSALILFFYAEIAKVKCATAPYNQNFCDAFDIDCQVAKAYPVCRPFILRHGWRKGSHPFADITRDRYMEHILAITPRPENFPYDEWDVIPPCPECPIPGNYLLVKSWHQPVKELIPGKTESKYWWTRWCKYNSIDFLDSKSIGTDSKTI